jgi:hypothetical protein
VNRPARRGDTVVFVSCANCDLRTAPTQCELCDQEARR